MVCAVSASLESGLRDGTNIDYYYIQRLETCDQEGETHVTFASSKDCHMRKVPGRELTSIVNFFKKITVEESMPIAWSVASP
jgi:hypothetical protein